MLLSNTNCLTLRFCIFMVELSRQTLFLCSLVLIYIFLNTCRRLLVATAPSLISENKLTQNGYGFLSSLSSVEFGVCRFLAYQVLDHVPIDKYMCFFSVLSCVVCGVMSIVSPDNLPVDPQLFYCVCFGILFICLGLPFPCSSMVVRQYIAPTCGIFNILLWYSDRNFIWSLIAISSCVGSIVATNLAYFVPNRSRFFQLVVQFGLGCTVFFYVFFPATRYQKEEKEAKETQASSLSRTREFLCILFCILTYFFVFSALFAEK